MSKFKVVRVIDFIFKTAIIFLLIFAWLRFYLADFWSSFLFAFAITIAIVYILSIIKNKKNGKKIATAKELVEIENCAINLALMTNQTQMDFFFCLLSKKYQCNKNKMGIEVNLDNKKTLVMVNINYEIMTKFETMNLIKNAISDYDSICIIGNSFMEETYKFASSFKNKKIKLFDKASVYQNFYKKYSLFPNNDLLKESANKLTFKEFLRGCFNHKKTKGYFFSGLLLIFASIIIPYSFYYIIFGSSLLFISLICLISKDNKIVENDIFE